MNPTTLPTSIPFGKHRGEPLTAVPTSYLIWFASTITGKPRLVEAARAELARRGVGAPPSPTPSSPAQPATGIAAKTRKAMPGPAGIPATRGSR